VSAGMNYVTEPDLDTFDVQSVALADPGAAAHPVASAGDSAVVTSWGSARRRVWIDTTAPSFLEVNENYNAGWQAVIGGHSLQPVRLDGWRQAWLLPRAMHGTVTLTYAPDAGYRRALFGGLAALALLMIVAVIPVRRRRAPAPLDPAAQAMQRATSTPGFSRGRLARYAVAAAGCAGAGFWLGGYPGAVLVPVAFAGFVLAFAVRPGPVCDMVRSPWVVAVLVLLAAASQALGNHIDLIGPPTSVDTVLSNTGPQLLCLLVVARLLAGLAWGEGATVGDAGGRSPEGGPDRVGLADADARSPAVEPVEPLSGPLD
jgi:arabinofuranan 3-O-arabinosyltransferase